MNTLEYAGIQYGSNQPFYNDKKFSYFSGIRALFICARADSFFIIIVLKLDGTLFISSGDNPRCKDLIEKGESFIYHPSNIKRALSNPVVALGLVKTLIPQLNDVHSIKIFCPDYKCLSMTKRAIDSDDIKDFLTKSNYSFQDVDVEGKNAYIVLKKNR